jgi:sugar-phosphatase
VIVAADDVTMCKPSPEPYLTAAHRLGVDPRAAVAIEDSAAGLVAARAAGMRTIALTTTSAPHLLTDADRVVATLAEVTPALVLGLSPSLP